MELLISTITNLLTFHFFSNDLEKRTFKTYDFYRKLQDNITPAGLAFFQSDHDSNLTEFYHNVLEMKEPIFEYDFPQSYHPPERYFPLRQAFNLYLDRYRDPKQVIQQSKMFELLKPNNLSIDHGLSSMNVSISDKQRVPGARVGKNTSVQWTIAAKTIPWCSFAQEYSIVVN